MGYACPVCETPQRDGEHLANHLAFTAMLRNDAHEEWLDEHTPGWGAAGADELAAQVTEQAPEAEFEAVFEDTADHSNHQHDHGSRSQHDQPPVNPDSVRGHGSGSLDADAQNALQEAQEMTQKLLDNRKSADGDADSDVAPEATGDAGADETFGPNGEATVDETAGSEAEGDTEGKES